MYKWALYKAYYKRTKKKKEVRRNTGFSSSAVRPSPTLWWSSSQQQQFGPVCIPRQQILNSASIREKNTRKDRALTSSEKDELCFLGSCSTQSFLYSSQVLGLFNILYDEAVFVLGRKIQSITRNNGGGNDWQARRTDQCRSPSVVLTERLAVPPPCAEPSDWAVFFIVCDWRADTLHKSGYVCLLRPRFFQISPFPESHRYIVRSSPCLRIYTGWPSYYVRR